MLSDNGMSSSVKGDICERSLESGKKADDEDNDNDDSGQRQSGWARRENLRREEAQRWPPEVRQYCLGMFNSLQDPSLPVGPESSSTSGYISLHPLQGSAQAHSLQRTFWNVVLRQWP